MIFLSLVLVIVAAVTLVLGVFQDGLVLIYVSIATCVAAMAVLGAGVLLRRREEASTGPAGYASTTRDSGVAVARTPVTVADDRGEEPAADAVDEQQTAVVRTVAAPPTAGDDDTPFRRPAAAGTDGTADEQDPVRPVAKRAVVKRTRTAAATAPTTEIAASEPDAAQAAAVAPVKRATVKKATVKKATAKKATAKKATAKKATAKKATARKATAKEATAKEAAPAGRSVSDLASVRGLGPAKRDKLVARFGSIDAVAAASVEDLMDVPGIGEATARAIKDALR